MIRYSHQVVSCHSLSPQLVVSVLRDVPHPGQSLVAGLLYDLQVSDLHQQLVSNIAQALRSLSAHLNTRRGEVRDLKLDVDGRLPFIEVSLHTGQEELSLHEVLLPPRERLDVPHGRALLRHVATVAQRGLKLGREGVARDRDDNLHVVGCGASLELRLGLHHNLYPRVGMLLYHRLHPD